MNLPERVFLSAEWKHLTLFNFSVPDDVLLPRLPQGCELDRFEGSAYISLVAFQFLNTRVFGIQWPGFVNFPEVNLRFYIRRKGQRGVCFIREYVPSRIITAIARLLYNEPYKTARMSGTVESPGEDEISARYTLNDRGRAMRVEVVGENRPWIPGEDSMEHFFKEHELGVGRDTTGNTITYRVGHPHWKIFPVRRATLELDWAAIYGKEFGFLQNRSADSVVFAEGSAIKVYGKSNE